MESSGLFSVLDNTAFPGGTLSIEERSALQASLVLLKESQHFTEVRRSIPRRMHVIHV